MFVDVTKLGVRIDTPNDQHVETQIDLAEIR